MRNKAKKQAIIQRANVRVFIANSRMSIWEVQSEAVRFDERE